MAVSTESSQHVLLVPFMAQGHFIPFLELADLLVRRASVTATLVTTPLNVAKLRSSIPPGSPIRFAELPFSGSDHGLPPDSESTDTLPAPYMRTFVFATETLQAPFERLVSGIMEEDGRRRPLLIVSDYFLGWTVETARKLKVPHAAFSTSGAFGTAVIMALWLRFPHLNTDSDTFNLPGFPNSVQLHRSQLPPSMRGLTPTDPLAVFVRRQLSLTLQSDAMLCNSVEEIEKAGAAILPRTFAAMPVWCVGPLLPRTFRRGGKDQVFDGARLMEWLDGRPPRSVVYVSFGSQNSIWPSQMKDLATALEGSGHPFVWAIRPPKGGGSAPESEWLPEGFEERVAASGQGMLVKTWAPQLEILSHRSTAAFLSHCGWNSVVESLSQGVPIIGWPVAAEQAFNLMVVEDLGVGVEVVRGVDDETDVGGVRRRVESALGMVVGSGGEKGLEMRKKAGNIARVFKSCAMDGGCQERSITELMSNFFGSKHI